MVKDGDVVTGFDGGKIAVMSIAHCKRGGTNMVSQVLRLLFVLVGVHGNAGES